MSFETWLELVFGSVNLHGLEVFFSTPWFHFNVFFLFVFLFLALTFCLLITVFLNTLFTAKVIFSDMDEGLCTVCTYTCKCITFITYSMFINLYIMITLYKVLLVNINVLTKNQQYICYTIILYVINKKYSCKLRVDVFLGPLNNITNSISSLTLPDHSPADQAL